MGFGEKLKEIRRAHLLSQEEFAKKLGVSRSIVSQVEINRIKPTVEALKKVASVFNVSLDYLMHDDRHMRTHSVSGPVVIENASIARDEDLIVSETNEKFYRNKLIRSQDAIAFLDEKNMEKEIAMPKIPYLVFERSDDYIKNGFEGFTQTPFPKLQLPVKESGILMAFELKKSQEEKSAIFVCRKININDLGLPSSVVALMQDTLVHGAVDTISASTIMINGMEYPITDIRELWLTVMHMQQGGEKEELQKRLDRIEELLMHLQKKKTKKKKK